MAAKETVLDESASIYQKREDKSEKQKWQEMNGKERWEYFNEYYRNKLIFGTIGVVLVAWLLYSVLGPSVDQILYIAVINDYWNDPAEWLLESDLADYLEADEKWEEVVIDDVFYFRDDSSSDAYNYVQKLAAYIAAGDVDLLVADEEQFSYYASEDYFLNLEEVLPADLYTEIQEYLVSYTSIDLGTTAPVGIRLSKSRIYQAMDGYQEEALIGIVANTSYQDNAVAAIRYFFESEVDYRTKAEMEAE